MKRILSFLLIAAMLVSLTACAKPQQEEKKDTVIFTDSLGRKVELPAKIEKIVPSGTMAQIVLWALAPDLFVGLTSAFDDETVPFIGEEHGSLPVLGQLYGGKGGWNMETLLSSGAEVVIDVGEPKDSAAEELDALQEQTGVPFVHITATTATVGEAYRKLGELLDRSEQAEQLAAYCDRVYAETLALSESVEKVGAIYCLGDRGLNVIAKGSYHAEILDLLTDNAAVVDNPSSKGTGNEVDMEQLLIWDPAVILFAPDSIYDTVGTDPLWQNLTAIKNGNYFKVPAAPYNWIGTPPSVQRYLGMLWLSSLLYPDAAEYDLYEAVKEYFDLFYRTELTREQFAELTEHSVK